MMLHLLRKAIAYPSIGNSVTRLRSFCSRVPPLINSEDVKPTPSSNYSSRIHLSPLFNDSSSHLGRYDIDLVDDETWQLSSALSHAHKGYDRERKSTRPLIEADDERVVDGSSPDDQDFDDIDNMRIRGNLFYKIDRASKEFEEYSYDFHRKKGSKSKDDHKESEKKESLRKKDDIKQSKRNERSNVKLLETVRNGSFIILDKVEGSSVEKKKVRTPTFNQLTGPYHEPFCLDIYISKASVRACIIHRATSKVVAVAHSISKDMKFDLGSTRNASACAAVGEILAQRALDDDIHDVIYTPRKGDKIEGKLQIVLQSIIDHGVNVKVKLKQRRPKKAAHASTT
ncbi:Ribosomal protein L18/L5 [Corchorus olitorius]|uniref:Ribosomal protein L18/L5 n=1 Tax=Corchorus olitorius TaxID=93759 RepID=A0A1R3IT24_9ROSI|nr:Ribosomal protein L18/L5 [Corchorus olitorius]